MGKSYFRKSKKIGPFRLTASKSGLSYSIGGKGARLTKRSDGKVQSTIGIPGSGLRFTEVHSRKQGQAKRAASSNAMAEQAALPRIRTSLSGWQMAGIFFGAFILINPILEGVFGEGGSAVSLLLSIAAVVWAAVWYRKRQEAKIEAARVALERKAAAEARRREELARVRPQPRLFKTTREAEILARDWIRYFGYVDAEVTDPGPDGGIDVESAGVVAQVKTNAQKIGRPIVQQTYGAAASMDKRAVVFALAGFTADAELWATDNDVALFEFDHAGGVDAVNIPAQAMLLVGDRRRLDGDH